MAIDHLIDYNCIPKQELGTEGLLHRIKGRERAETIIRLYREHGDERPPVEMGFELSRSDPNGGDETQLIVVQDLLDAAAELKPLEKHCHNCPANAAGRPFGCMGFIQYPISTQAESWLLNQLPTPAETLVWLLLKQGAQEFLYTGDQIKRLRESSSTYFEADQAAKRVLGEFQIDANQVFEMIFAVGHIQPNHGAVLMLFFNIIKRALEAHQIMSISPAGPDADQAHPFQAAADESDDATLAELKAFFKALHTAWKLNVRLLIDA